MSRLPSGVERSRALAARGAAPGAHAPIVVEAGELTLAKGVALEESKLVVTASALGLDAHASAAADVKVGKGRSRRPDSGRCASRQAPLPRRRGSKLAAALAAALPLAEDDCSIELVVSSVDKRQGGRGSAPRPSR